MLKKLLLFEWMNLKKKRERKKKKITKFSYNIWLYRCKNFYFFPLQYIYFILNKAEENSLLLRVNETSYFSIKYSRNFILEQGLHNFKKGPPTRKISRSFSISSLILSQVFKRFLQERNFFLFFFFFWNTFRITRRKRGCEWRWLAYIAHKSCDHLRGGEGSCKGERWNERLYVPASAAMIRPWTAASLSPQLSSSVPGEESFRGKSGFPFRGHRRSNFFSVLSFFFHVFKFYIQTNEYA